MITHTHTHTHTADTVLTFDPVAEGVPGLTEVVALAVVYDAHVTESTLGVGVGGGVGHSGLLQPACCTQVVASLWHSVVTSMMYDSAACLRMKMFLG